MAVPSLNVTVMGQAAGLTASAKVAEPWKQLVSRKVGSEWHHGCIEEPCAISLTYNMPGSSFKRTALFNLLKSTIDGLGDPVFAHCAKGHSSRWNREDWWITNLYVRKQQTDQEPNVRITIGAPVLELAYPPEAVTARAFVSGSPPLWPGDNVGAEKVRRWREMLQAALQVIKPVHPGAALALDLRFVIEPDRMTSSDLDNFIVPAAQAVCFALFGSFRYPQSVVELHATKEAISAGQQPGVHVRVWQV